MNLNLDFDFVEKKTAHSKQVLPYMKLWWAVLLQAVNDATHESTGNMSRRVVLDWFESNKHDVCSFIWICDTLDLNYEYVRDNVLRINMEREENEEKIKNYVVKDPKRKAMIQRGEAKLKMVDGKVTFIVLEKKNGFRGSNSKGKNTNQRSGE
jgi:hypothetical protein